MKRAEVKKDVRDFGNACDWYNKDNMAAVEAANPVKNIGRFAVAAAYFVELVEEKRDEMRECGQWYKVRRAVAGPFPTEAAAMVWADSYNNCPF